MDSSPSSLAGIRRRLRTAKRLVWLFLFLWLGPLWLFLLSVIGIPFLSDDAAGGIGLAAVGVIDTSLAVCQIFLPFLVWFSVRCYRLIDEEEALA